MKRILAVLLLAVMVLSLAACSGKNDVIPVQEPDVSRPVSESAKTLVAYFSMPDDESDSTVTINGETLGNTQYMAYVIQENTNANIFRIVPKTPYPTDHDELIDLAKEEQNNNARPEIDGAVENIADYDTIFVGYPNWWGDMPMILYTFFDTYDFFGKTIIPFNTHGGSGFSDTISTIKELEPDADVKDGLSISRNDIQDAEQEITDWVKELGFEQSDETTQNPNSSESENTATTENPNNDSTSNSGNGTETAQNQTGTGSETPASKNNPSTSTPESVAPPVTEPSVSKQRILVAFFSRTGENYGVGVIEKGNTHIIADMIADETGADTFEIARVTPYPENYRECTNEAQSEKNANARPALTATVDNFDDYDVIFLGYPNWWGDMPMPVYTFLESYDFSGKTVIPFCTHAGSGLSGTVQTLKNKLTDATVLDGLAIAGTTAQNNQSEAQKAVANWLGGLKY